MLRRVFHLTLVTLSSLFIFPSVAKADLLYARTFQPTFCQMAIDRSWKVDCDRITIGLTPDYSAFNIKFCNTSGIYQCLILVGEASELYNYPGVMKVYQVSWQDGKKITRDWTGSLLFGPYKGGHGVVGTIEGSVIAIYFTN